MKLADLFAAQLEREAAVSRRVLERVPEGRPDWKPHEKSMALGYLATLVATMPSWIAMTVARTSWTSTRREAGATSRPRGRRTPSCSRPTSAAWATREAC